MPGPTFLYGESVDLRVIEEEDLPFLQRVINNPQVRSTLQQIEPITTADERAFYENVILAESETHLLICKNADPVGVVGLNNIEPTWGIAEIGFYVDPDASGNGYASEGVHLISEYALNQRRLDRLYAYVIEGNIASQRVLEKNGFESEGRLRQHAYLDGERHDVIVYGLV